MTGKTRGNASGNGAAVASNAASAKGPNQLTRGLELLQKLAADNESKWGVREIGRLLGVPPGTAHRLVTLLAEQGMVSQDPSDGRYVLGPRLYALASKVKLETRVERVAVPHLHHLVSDTNETVLLGVYHPAVMSMMFVTAVESPHPLRYVVDLHTLLPLHAGASGLAILAFLPEREQRVVLERLTLETLTPETIVDPDELRQELERTRELGYSISHGQRIPGAVGIAAPILDATDEVIGDVMVTMPEGRFVSAEEKRLAASVMRCAAEISRDLGREKTDEGDA